MSKSKALTLNWFYFFLIKLALNNTKYYKILGVDKDASQGNIRKACRTFLRCHPGKGPDPEIYREIQNAFEVLSNPEKRRIYD